MCKSVRGIRRWGVLLAMVTWVAGCNLPLKTPIPAARYQGVTRVACIGDSITAGSGLENPSEASYPAVLGRILGPPYDVRNFGVSGATLLREGDLPYTKTPEFEEALEFRPDIVVIALGTNDSKPTNWMFLESFERDLYRLARAFRSLPTRPMVFLCTPPPVFRDRWGITASVVRDEIAPTIRRIAAREGWRIVDWHTALRDDPAVFPDAVHPDAVGAARMAAQVEATFRGN